MDGAGTRRRKLLLYSLLTANIPPIYLLIFNKMKHQPYIGLPAILGWIETPRFNLKQNNKPHTNKQINK
jgi:hypothetical protein